MRDRGGVPPWRRAPRGTCPADRNSVDVVKLAWRPRPPTSTPSRWRPRSCSATRASYPRPEGDDHATTTPSRRGGGLPHRGHGDLLRAAHRGHDGVAIGPAGLPQRRRGRAVARRPGRGRPGVEDYLYRLNQDGNYWRWSATTPPPDDDPASRGPPRCRVAEPGHVLVHARHQRARQPRRDRLRATGSVGDQSRTSTSPFPAWVPGLLYFTDLEAVDPVLYPTRGAGTATGPRPTAPGTAWATPPVTATARRSPSTRAVASRTDPGGPDQRPHASAGRWSSWEHVVELSPPSDDSEPQCPPGRSWTRAGATCVRQRVGSGPRRLTLPPNNQTIRVEADEPSGGRAPVHRTDHIELRGTACGSTARSLARATAGDTPGAWQPLPANGVV